MKVIRVAAAVIKKGNQLLIAQRPTGKWEFPGGKLEQGEIPPKTIKRELMEEMEIHIHVGEYLMTAEYDYETFHLIMDCYICSLIDDNIKLNDHLAIQWIDINEDINNIDWVPADVQVFEAIQKKYL